MAGETAPGMESLGTKLGYESATPGSFTDIARMTTIKMPSAEYPLIDFTNLSSTAKDERAGGLPDFGETGGTFNYLPSDEAWIETILKVKKKYRVLYPDGSSHTFDGTLYKVERGDATVDGKAEATLSIRIQSKPAIVEAP